MAVLRGACGGGAPAAGKLVHLLCVSNMEYPRLESRCAVEAVEHQRCTEHAVVWGPKPGGDPNPGFGSPRNPALDAATPMTSHTNRIRIRRVETGEKHKTVALQLMDIISTER